MMSTFPTDRLLDHVYDFCISKAHIPSVAFSDSVTFSFHNSLFINCPPELVTYVW
jgi:hypothetical protein